MSSQGQRAKMMRGRKSHKVKAKSKAPLDSLKSPNNNGAFLFHSLRTAEIFWVPLWLQNTF